MSVKSVDEVAVDRPLLTQRALHTLHTVDLSDMLNGDYIRDHLATPTVTYKSIEDASLAPK